MKKQFYFLKVKQNRRYYGGLNVKALLFRIHKGKLEKIGSCKWCTASYRGEESEVFQALMALGYIPKKYKSSSICGWRAGGYFAGDVCEKYEINEIC